MALQRDSEKQNQIADGCLDMYVETVSWSLRKFAGSRQPVQ